MIPVDIRYMIWNIFSHSVGFIFSFLMMIFDVQKCFILMKSNLSSFCFCHLSYFFSLSEVGVQHNPVGTSLVTQLVKNPPVNAGDLRLISLQYSCLKNPMDQSSLAGYRQTVGHNWGDLACMHVLWLETDLRFGMWIISFIWLHAVVYRCQLYPTD